MVSLIPHSAVHLGFLEVSGLLSSFAFFFFNSRVIGRGLLAREVLSFHRVGLRDRIRVGLPSRHLYLLSRLTGPELS